MRNCLDAHLGQIVCDKDGVVEWCIVLVEMLLTRFEECWNLFLVLFPYPSLFTHFLLSIDPPLFFQSSHDLLFIHLSFSLILHSSLVLHLSHIFRCSLTSRFHYFSTLYKSIALQQSTLHWSPTLPSFSTHYSSSTLQPSTLHWSTTLHSFSTLSCYMDALLGR